MGAEVVATTPELWETFVDICMSLGIDMTQLPALRTPQAIVEFCQTLNIQLQPLYREVTTLEQEGWTWVVNNPVNPSETTDLVVRGVTDLVVTGGGATSISRGKNLFGTVSRRVAAGAMIAALGVSTFVAQIGEHISRLVEGLTPWTTDGVDAVPVMIDENGNTYLDARAIQQFREDLADLGIFDLERIISTPVSGITVDFNFPIEQVKLTDCPYITVKYSPDSQTTCSGYDLSKFGYSENPGTEGGRYYLLLEVKTWGTITPDDLYLTVVPKTVPSNSMLVVLACKGKYDSTFRYAYQIYRINANGVQDYASTMSNIKLYNLNDANFPGSTYYYNRNTVTNAGSWVITTGTNYQPNIFSYSNYYNFSKTLLYGLAEGGGGVPGFEPTNTTVGDLTKSLTDIFPDWTDNAVTIPSPKDDDLENTADWLPVSITSTEPFEQDHTATSDDQDGDTTEDVQEGILQKMMELIQSLTQTSTGNPDEVVTPTIPVGDSGDSPPATPTVISGASNGLWTIYNPTLSEVQQFGGWLWSESLIDQIIRQFNNPIEAVIGFMSIYCTPITGDRKVIKAGYLSSPVSAKEVTNQYVTINCGQVEVPEYYHTAVDYTRSKVEIFLPFIGIVPLDCSVVTGSTLEVIYRIDVLTGTCLAQIKVIKQNSDAVMYTYPGNCAVQLPLTASTYTGMVGAIMGAISGGFALGMGDVGGGIKKLGEGLVSGMSNLSGTAKSGNLSSNAGALGIRIPYLIITHPTVYDAMIYNQFYGYPSNVYQRLSAMSGFVRVKDIHLDSISCTEQERDMIYARLKEGVIIS